jgi:hypothetical protein
MTTENPKVAGYISQEIYDALTQFKEDQGHKSISQALTHVLSDYLGVEKKVNYQGSLLLDDKFVTLDQFRELEERFGSLPSELLSESVKIIEEKISKLRSELLNSLKSEPLNEPLSKLLDNLPSEPSSELLEPMTGAALNKRFNQAEGGVTKMKSKHKNNPQRFTEWTKTKDPDGIAWEFKEGLYYPIRSEESSTKN